MKIAYRVDSVVGLAVVALFAATDGAAQGPGLHKDLDPTVSALERRGWMEPSGVLLDDPNRLPIDGDGMDELAPGLSAEMTR